MKMTENSILLVSISIASLGLIAYGAYRILKRKRVITNTLDNCDIQRVNILSLKSVIDWIDNVIGEELSSYDKLEVNIFPNLATKELLGQNAKLSQKDINNCNFVIIMHPDMKQIIKRKLIINNNIADDLVAVKEGKIFKVPVE